MYLEPVLTEEVLHTQPGATQVRRGKPLYHFYRRRPGGPPRGATTGGRRAEADAIAKTAIASRQRVKSSGSVFCWAKTLG